MTRHGLPVGPPPPQEDLLDLPLAPQVAESPFLRPQRRKRLRPRRRGLSAGLALALQAAAVGLLAVLGAWTAWQRVFASERLRVGRLEVRGSHFLSEGEVRELVGPAVGENILGLDIEALKARLRASPWVADATVTRALPDTLRVEIRERVPLALAELDRLYLMDSDGGLIDIYGPRTGAFDLPIVRGLLGVEEESRRDRARRAGALLADLAELGSEVSEVYVLPTGDLRVVLRGPGEVLLFGEPPYRERLVTFLSLRKELAERAPDAEHFDLRYKGAIYAKRPGLPAHPSPPAATEAPHPAPGAAVAPSAGGGSPAVPEAVNQPQHGDESRAARSGVTSPQGAGGLGGTAQSRSKPQAPRGGEFTSPERGGGLGGATERRNKPQAAPGGELTPDSTTRWSPGSRPRSRSGVTPAQRAGGLGRTVQSGNELRAPRGGEFTSPERGGGLGGTAQSRNELRAAPGGEFTSPQGAGGLGGATEHPPEES